MIAAITLNSDRTWAFDISSARAQPAWTSRTPCWTPIRSPAIVFVTAHDQFALRAFEVSAIDYLVKPVDRAALRPDAAARGEARGSASGPAPLA